MAQSNGFTILTVIFSALCCCVTVVVVVSCISSSSSSASGSQSVAHGTLGGSPEDPDGDPPFLWAIHTQSTRTIRYIFLKVVLRNKYIQKHSGEGCSYSAQICIFESVPRVLFGSILSSGRILKWKQNKIRSDGFRELLCRQWEHAVATGFNSLSRSTATHKNNWISQNTVCLFLNLL